ncbi:sulfite exporter TauE/SafE family protein [Mammaliicoccus stepanovicii]|nr:sulfite exporter TauE/SafE family protein [Mammaliicoccus stepanovicii]
MTGGVDLEFLTLFIVFLVGIFAGTINIVSAGGSLIVLPILIFFGLPTTVANASNRVAILVQNLLGLYVFYIKGMRNVKLSIILSIPAIIGSFIGVHYAINLPDAVFNRMLGVIMLLVLIVMIIPTRWKDGHNKSEKITTFRKILLVIVFLALGIYGGIVQAAVGFLFILALNILLPKLNYAEVQCMKTLVITIYLSLSTFIFIFQGYVNWPFAISLALGSGIGGFIGGRLTVSLPEKQLKIIMFVIIFFLAIKLLIDNN